MTIDLDVLEGLLLYPGATQGPWVASGRYIGTPNHMSYVGEVRDQNGNWTDTAKSRSDAALIVAAVNALPDLIAIARERDAMREALTPSGDTKAAYHGEFKFQVTQWRENEGPDSDEEQEEYLADFTVPWTTVKEIMAAISARARQALNTGDQS